MKTKNSTKPIFLLLLILGALWWSGCGNECDDPCPPVKQPEPELLSKYEKQRFPYDKFKSLTFQVTEPGRVDTVKLFRIKYDSLFLNFGEALPPCWCPPTYSSRHQFFTAVYGESKNADRLVFQNQEFGKSMNVLWNEDSTWTSHSFLNGFLGAENQKIDHDTVTVLGKDYWPTHIADGFTENGDSLTFMYNYNYGFIYLNDKKRQKQWELISIEFY
ncbi:MAG: hypothetical protein ACPGLV_13940 [Bacteroidia bacterium]